MSDCHRTPEWENGKVLQRLLLKPQPGKININLGIHLNEVIKWLPEPRIHPTAAAPLLHTSRFKPYHISVIFKSAFVHLLYCQQ